MATDLAEFLGAAVGFHLLFGIPLFPAALITGHRDLRDPRPAALGFRPLEAVIAVMVGVIGVCYLAELCSRTRRSAPSRSTRSSRSSQGSESCCSRSVSSARR